MKPPRIAEWFARDGRVEKSGAPNLMARNGYAEDLNACRALYRASGVPCSDACWRALPDMWRDLLANGTMQLFVVEDRTKPPGSRIVSFSATIFVDDGFCCEVQSTLPPYLGPQLTQQCLARALQVLNPEQSARANAHDGLNVMMCFEGWEHDGLSREQFLVIREKQSEAFHLGLSGYHVKEFLADPMGQERLQWMLNAGACLRRDYCNYFRKHRVFIPKCSQRPWLVGLTRGEACAHPGSHIANLFIYTPPRFHFNRSEQVLLHHALLGETCEQEAASLSISSWTVKKRWHAIYERVADVDSELLPPPIANGLHTPSRGAERRRHLLYYLRQHPEELRPFSR